MSKTNITETEMLRMGYQKTVVFDFDGVIHSYNSGWKGVCIIPDPPVPGIKECIEDIRTAGYKVVVSSTRCESPVGCNAVAEWLKEHNIIVDAVVRDKPPAVAYIDDRAICFDGKCDKLLERIERFVPWYQKEKDTHAKTDVPVKCKYCKKWDKTKRIPGGCACMHWSPSPKPKDLRYTTPEDYCSNGRLKVSADTIDDLIEYWHTHETGNSLPEFLGMTDSEYEDFVKHNILPD